jgi:Tfp pilus assembly protein PilF
MVTVQASNHEAGMHVSVSKEKLPDVREPVARAVEATRRSDFAAAIEHLKTAVAADPRHVVALGMLAGVYAELKMIDRAESNYRRVLELDPSNVLARFQLGLLQLASGRAREATETWEPSLRDSQDYLCHFHSALAHAGLGENARARELLERAAERMPASHALCGQLRELRQKLTTISP